MCYVKTPVWEYTSILTCSSIHRAMVNHQPIVGRSIQLLCFHRELAPMDPWLKGVAQLGWRVSEWEKQRGRGRREGKLWALSLGWLRNRWGDCRFSGKKNGPSFSLRTPPKIPALGSGSPYFFFHVRIQVRKGKNEQAAVSRHPWVGEDSPSLCWPYEVILTVKAESRQTNGIIYSDLFWEGHFFLSTCFPPLLLCEKPQAEGCLSAPSNIWGEAATFCRPEWSRSVVQASVQRLVLQWDLTPEEWMLTRAYYACTHRLYSLYAIEPKRQPTPLSDTDEYIHFLLGQWWCHLWDESSGGSILILYLSKSTNTAM